MKLKRKVAKILSFGKSKEKQKNKTGGYKMKEQQCTGLISCPHLISARKYFYFSLE
jgi:hypothetical protein